MLSPIQETVLRCLLIEPEDPKAFARCQAAARARARYAKNPNEACTKHKKWKQENPEKVKKSRRLTHARSRDHNNLKHREWTTKNKGAVRSYHTKYCADRRERDTEFKLLTNLRNRLKHAVRGIGNRSAGTKELLGCTLLDLRTHLESQFRPGMTWENYGPVWHVDHIKPCVKFDLTDPAQQRECFNFKNLQPLFAEENLKKGSR